MALGAAQKFVKAVLKLWAGFRPQIKAGIRPSKWDRDADTRLFPQGSSHVSRGSGASERQKNDPQDLVTLKLMSWAPEFASYSGLFCFSTRARARIWGKNWRQGRPSFRFSIGPGFRRVGAGC